MQSTTDLDEVTRRIGLVNDLSANLRLGGPRVWMRLESNQRHDTRHEGYPAFEQVIGVEAGDMATAFGKNGNAWRTLFKESKPRAGGFIHGVDSGTVFISVASTEKGVEEKPEDLSPTTGRKMDKEMMKQVQSKLKEARKLDQTSRPSRPKKKQKVEDDTNDRSGTSAEPKTTSTLASGPPSSNDGAPSLPETSRKRKATGDAAQISPPTARKDDASVDKLPCAKVAAALNIELDMDKIREDVLAIVRTSVSSSSAIMPEGNVNRLALEVLHELSSKSDTGTAEITSVTSNGKSKTRKFTLHPVQRRRLDPNATPKARAEWVRKKTKQVRELTSSVLKADTPYERAMARRVIDNIAQTYGGKVRSAAYQVQNIIYGGEQFHPRQNWSIKHGNGRTVGTTEGIATRARFRIRYSALSQLLRVEVG